MKRISIQDLKATLSGAIADAEGGDIILVTRHNEPVAQLGPAQDRGVRRGSRVGAGRLRPAASRASKGAYLAVLFEDRGSH